MSLQELWRPWRSISASTHFRIVQAVGKWTCRESYDVNELSIRILMELEYWNLEQWWSCYLLFEQQMSWGHGSSTISLCGLGFAPQNCFALRDIESDCDVTRKYMSMLALSLPLMHSHPCVVIHLVNESRRLPVTVTLKGIWMAGIYFMFFIVPRSKDLLRPVS